MNLKFLVGGLTGIILGTLIGWQVPNITWEVAKFNVFIGPVEQSLAGTFKLPTRWHAQYDHNVVYEDGNFVGIAHQPEILERWVFRTSPLEQSQHYLNRITLYNLVGVSSWLDSDDGEPEGLDIVATVQEKKAMLNTLRLVAKNKKVDQSVAVQDRENPSLLTYLTGFRGEPIEDSTQHIGSADGLWSGYLTAYANSGQDYGSPYVSMILLNETIESQPLVLVVDFGVHDPAFERLINLLNSGSLTDAEEMAKIEAATNKVIAGNKSAAVKQAISDLKRLAESISLTEL